MRRPTIRPLGASRPFRLYLCYTALFALTAALVYLPFFLSGKGFVWNEGPGDGLYQHFNTFVYLGKTWHGVISTLLREGRLVLPMWDFAIGYGGDVVTTLSFYGLGDPFNLLAVFFRPESAELGYSLALLLRIYCAGLAFCCYCRKMDCSRLGTLCGALAYVFSCYLMYAGIRHPMFIGPTIWLPLIWFGVEKLLRREHPAPYVLAVCAAALSNFYFFYMLVIFTVLYALLRAIGESDGKFQNALLHILRIAGWSLLGFAMAAALFLPSAMAFLSSSRSGGTAGVPLFYTPETYYKYPGSLISDSNASLWAHIGLCPLAILGVWCEFVTRRKQRWGKLLYVLYLLFLIFPVCGYALNGFGYVTNRWVFAYAMLGCFLFARNLETLYRLSAKKKLALCAIAAVYTILIFALKESRKEPVLVSLGLLLLGLAFVLLGDSFRSVLSRGRLSFRRVWQGGVLLLTILGVVITSAYRFAPTKGNYVESYLPIGTALEALEGGDGCAFELIDDEGFYRVDSGRTGYINRNFALHQGVSSTSVYWSILPKYMSEYLANVQAYDAMQSLYKGLQSRAMLLPFASVKYYVSRESPCSQTPWGFYELERYETNAGVARVLYQSVNVLGIGYSYDSCVSQSAYLAMTPVQRQQAMLYGAILPDGAADGTSLRQAEPSFTDYTVPLQFQKGDGVELEADGSFRVTKKNGVALFSANCPAGEELYLILEGLEVTESDEASFSLYGWIPGMASSVVGHYTEQSIYAHGRQDYLLNLYTSAEAHDSVKLKFSQPGVYHFSDLRLVAQPMTGFAEAISGMREQQLQEVRIETNRVSGVFTADTERVLCFSIPYAEGWSLTVDGKPATLLRANDMYMGTILPAGTHTIELRYRTPYLKPAIAVSGAALLGLIAYSVLRKLRARRKQQKEPD